MKKERSKEKVGTGENEQGTATKEKRKEKRKKDAAHAIVDSDEEEEDEDSDGYEDIFDADICIGRVPDQTGADSDLESPRGKGRDRSNSNEKKHKHGLEGDRSKEKRKARKSSEKDGLASEHSGSRQKRKSKERNGKEGQSVERSESVLRYYQRYRAARNDATRWKNKYREIMTDVLIQRVLLKHTNRVIWGKNSIKGRSAASNPKPLKYRKSIHILTDSGSSSRSNADQITPFLSGTVDSSPASSLTSSRESSFESSSAASISSPHTPLSTSSLSMSACITLRSLPPAFSSPSFYCPYKFRVCSQRGKLQDAAQFGLVSHSAEEMSVYVLLYASREDLPSPQIIPFLVTATTGTRGFGQPLLNASLTRMFVNHAEGVHKEPAYHSTIRTYGGGPEPVKLSTLAAPPSLPPHAQLTC